MKMYSVLAASVILTVTSVAALEAAAAASKPRWVLHVERYPGGISNGVRFSLDSEVVRAQARNKQTQALAKSPPPLPARAMSR